MIPFSHLKFGKASAELESAYFPELLLQGFFDLGGLVGQIRQGPTCLVLGYKGSGKSALGEHLRLTSESDPELFVKHVFLSDFPFSNFRKIVEGEAEPEVKYPTAWSWILLLALLDSFTKDEGAQSHWDNDFSCSVDALQKVGLLPNPSLKQMVLTSSKTQFKAKLPPLFEVICDLGHSHGQDIQFLNIVEYLKYAVTRFSTSSQHLLVIDGLDDILTSSHIQYESLAALILEVSRLNLLFFRNGTNAKILLLCRTELYERLPGPNKNKIRQDVGAELDWYHDPRDPFSSNLVKLVNQRARLSENSIIDIFIRYFPSKMDYRPILPFLLDHTRHTPRDFVQLIVHIQKFSKSNPMDKEQILSGLRDYSINYFFPEIRDELVGYCSTNRFDYAMKMIGGLKKRHFKFDELLSLCNQHKFLTEDQLTNIVAALFDCSAIGNQLHRTSGSAYFSFKYRNRNAILDIGKELILHRGLWKAMNLV